MKREIAISRNMYLSPCRLHIIVGDVLKLYSTARYGIFTEDASIKNAGQIADMCEMKKALINKAK